MSTLFPKRGVYFRLFKAVKFNISNISDQKRQVL